MATVIVYPASDDSVAWDSATPPGAHYSCVDDVGAPNTADFIEQSGASQQVDSFTVTAHGLGADISVTAVEITAHARHVGPPGAGNIACDIYMAGAWVGYEVIITLLTSAWATYAKEFSGLWTGADLTNMKMRIRSASPGAYSPQVLAQFFATATYTWDAIGPFDGAFADQPYQPEPY